MSFLFHQMLKRKTGSSAGKSDSESRKGEIVSYPTIHLDTKPKDVTNNSTSSSSSKRNSTAATYPSTSRTSGARSAEPSKSGSSPRTSGSSSAVKTSGSVVSKPVNKTTAAAKTPNKTNSTNTTKNNSTAKPTAGSSGKQTSMSSQDQAKKSPESSVTIKQEGKPAGKQPENIPMVSIIRKNLSFKSSESNEFYCISFGYLLAAFASHTKVHFLSHRRLATRTLFLREKHHKSQLRERYMSGIPP